MKLHQPPSPIANALNIDILNCYPNEQSCYSHFLVVTLLSTSCIHATVSLVDGSDIGKRDAKAGIPQEFSTVSRRNFSLKEICRCIRRFIRLLKRAVISDPASAKRVCEILVKCADLIREVLDETPSDVMKSLLGILEKLIRWFDCGFRDILLEMEGNTRD